MSRLFLIIDITEQVLIHCKGPNFGPDFKNQVFDVFLFCTVAAKEISNQSNTDVIFKGSITSLKSCCWYKGCKVDVTWLKSSFTCIVPLRLESVKCALCSDNNLEANKVSRRKVVALTGGARCYSKQGIKRLIDPLESSK